MSKRIDMVGQRFGRLVVEEYAYTNNGIAYWKCKCDCGGEVIARGINLRSGNTKSCGCLEKENRERLKRKFFEEHFRHGEKRTALYRRWCHMKERCFDKKNKDYELYGGRGIMVCGEWLGENGYLRFAEWAKSNGYEDGLTLDRIDVNGNYEPGNCRWVDIRAQSNNRRSNRLIEINGETKTLAEWCRIYGMNYGTVEDRICYGWDEKRAIMTPVDEKRRKAGKKSQEKRGGV